jgi:hypothetical protein
VNTHKFNGRGPHRTSGAAVAEKEFGVAPITTCTAGAAVTAVPSCTGSASVSEKKAGRATTSAHTSRSAVAPISKQAGVTSVASGTACTGQSSGTSIAEKKAIVPAAAPNGSSVAVCR